MAGCGEYEPVDPNSATIQSFAHFVVHDHNNKQETQLELKKVLKAEKQRVDGTNYRLTLEVTKGGLVDGNLPEFYKAIIYVNVKEFNQIVPP